LILRLRIHALLGLLAAVAVAASAPPAGASRRAHNGRIALAWLDRDAGAHEEAAWQIITVPWRTGSGRGRPVVSCTMVDGCPALYSSPDYSPDGKQIVYTATSLNGPGPSRLTLSDADGSHATVLSTGPHDSYDSSFLPSGSGLIFVRSGQTAADVSSDPQGQIVTLDLTDGAVSPIGHLRGSAPRVSPDGKQVLFTHRGGVWVADARGRDVRRLVAHGSHGVFSPDGRSILYVSGAPLSGIHRLYLARADGRNRAAVRASPRSDRPRRPGGVLP
jgi:Tol biopolymer transport system component